MRRSILARLRRGERIEHFDTVRVARDGRRIDVSLTVIADPRRQRAGRRRLEGRARRHRAQAAEELQRLLLDELNHRVKNTLATIQAIASQSLRAEPEPGEPSSRASAAGSRRWRGRTTCWCRRDAAAPSSPTRARAGGARRPAIRAMRLTAGADGGARSAASAVQLALVLHELATNARKHGALAVAGRAARDRLVDWCVEAGPEAGADVDARPASSACRAPARRTGARASGRADRALAGRATGGRDAADATERTASSARSACRCPRRRRAAGCGRRRPARRRQPGAGRAPPAPAGRRVLWSRTSR